jgi:hypothetical protein
MQNEKLFEKIKNTALTETSGTDEYNPEKLWADINKRKNKKSMWLWGTYAAVASVLLSGVFFWFLKVQHTETSVQAEVSRIETPPVNLLEKKEADDMETNLSTDANDSVFRDSKFLIKQKSANSDQSPVTTDLQIPALSLADSIEPKDDITTIIDTTNFEKNNQNVNESTTEKVLIADISIPEEKAGEYPALRQIFDQARKERHARKMRIQFNREIKKPGLWSFVHHSFVQYPSVRPSILLQKKAEDIPH